MSDVSDIPVYITAFLAMTQYRFGALGSVPLLRQQLLQFQRAPPKRCTQFTSFLSTTATNSKSVPVRTDSKSLAWVRIHDRSPASYGVYTFDGYLELISTKEALPCKRTEALESAFDYISHATWTICYRLSLLHMPVEITNAELHDLRVARKGNTKVLVTMEMDKDLKGKFTAQDTFTRSKISVEFDGGPGSQSINGGNSLAVV